MSLTTRAGLLAGAAALTLTGVGAASAGADANTDELRAQVREMQARIAELEGRSGDQWLTEKRASEIRGLVQDVLADADTRASLLSSGMVAGYDNGFQIGDPTGNFLLQVNGQLQARWLWNRQRTPENQFEDASGMLTGASTPVELDSVLGIGPVFVTEHDGDRHRSGFENTRTKLWFSGHILNPNWRYNIEADFSHLGNVQLLDAWIAHEYGDTGFVATIGQFKLPLLREELVDSRYQLAVERSLVNSLFSAGRSTGIMVSWQQDMFRVFGAFSDGARQQNTRALDFTTEWALTGRLEFLAAGTWGQFNEFRSPDGEEFGLMIGGGAHYETDEYGTDFDTTERLILTADASAKFGGFNAFGAYIFSHGDVDGNGNWQNHAIVGQGGFHLTPEWEIFGRYEHVFWDNDLDDVQDLSIVTAGINHYMFGGGHSAKWSTDFGYAFNRVAVGDMRTGWRADGVDGRTGQFVLRTQFQLAF